MPTPTACINSQNDSVTASLREYLLTHGCTVIEKFTDTVFIDYHIVCGNGAFVEKIFTSKYDTNTRRLAIVLDSQQPQVDTHTKIIFIDFTVLDKEILAKILKFFFTSRKQVLDLRKNPKNMNPEKTQVFVRKSAHVPEMNNDNERISSLIAEIFHPKKNKKKVRMKIHPMRIVIFIFLFPFFWYLVSMIASSMLTIGSAHALVSGKTRISSKLAKFSQIPNSQTRFILRFIAVPFQLVNRQELIRNQEQLIALLDDISISIIGAEKLLSEGQVLARDLITRGDSPGRVSPAESVERIRNELFSLHTRVSLASAQLTKLLTDHVFPFWIPLTIDRGNSALSTIGLFTRWINDMDRLLLLYPRLSGFTQKKTYLLLLQNSMELRPTGGFIGSVATITVEEGRLLDIQVQDVYVLDGQLKGHVDPPTPLRDLMRLEHWYLRDSNWHPNFEESGNRALWFYEKETGTKVDGVIGISVPFITKILTVTGPLTLSDYNDQVTSENFFGKSLYYTQADFFPGSTQKKDFLGSLTTTLINELTTQSLSPTAVFRALTESLLSHDLVFYFTDPELQSLVTEFGWAGDQLSTVGCQGTDRISCLFDPSYIVEANIGINKANYFVRRSQSREIKFGEDGTIEHTWNVQYHNASSGQAGSGPYSAYTRFYLPEDSRVLSITMDGNDLVQYAEPIDKVDGYISVGVSYLVPPGEDGHVVLRYARGKQVHFEKQQAVYEHMQPRQPGTASEELSIIVRYPVFWVSSGQEEDERLVANERKLEYNRTLESDQMFTLKFLK